MMDEHLDSSSSSGHRSGGNSSDQAADVEQECDLYSYSLITIPALYLMMFPIALLLNVVAAWVSLHLKSTTTFVVYLKHLVAADIIITLMIPIKAASNLPGKWVYLVEPSCRFFSVIFYNTQYTCIALLGLISVDRFFKIMMPRSRLFGQNLTLSKLLSASIWVIMFGVAGLPSILLTNQTVTNITKATSCMMLKGPEGIEFHEKITIFLNAFFWLVSVVIVVCYICIANKVIQSYRNSGSNNSQGQQKLKLRIFLVIIVFFVSFGPYHIVRIPYTAQQVRDSSKSCSPEYIEIRFAKKLAHWLATTNICMDPLLYVFLCREFKDKLMSMMKTVFISFKAAAGNKADNALPDERI